MIYYFIFLLFIRLRLVFMSKILFFIIKKKTKSFPLLIKNIFKSLYFNSITLINLINIKLARGPPPLKLNPSCIKMS
jgi:hypothetical protein